MFREALRISNTVCQVIGDEVLIMSRCVNKGAIAASLLRETIRHQRSSFSSRDIQKHESPPRDREPVAGHDSCVVVIGIRIHEYTRLLKKKIKTTEFTFNTLKRPEGAERQLGRMLQQASPEAGVALRCFECENFLQRSSQF